MRSKRKQFRKTMKGMSHGFQTCSTRSDERKKIRRSWWTIPLYVSYERDVLYLHEGDDKCREFPAFVKNILAHDWEVVPEPPRLLTFAEALVELRNGKTLKRKDSSTQYNSSSSFTLGDMNANDWQIVVKDEMPKPSPHNDESPSSSLKTMSFMEAWKHAKQEKKIARLAWTMISTQK